MRVQERGHSEYFISPAYRLAEENQNVPLIPPLNLNLPYQRTELEGRAKSVFDRPCQGFCGLGI